MIVQIPESVAEGRGGGRQEMISARAAGSGSNRYPQAQETVNLGVHELRP